MRASLFCYSLKWDFSSPKTTTDNNFFFPYTFVRLIFFLLQCFNRELAFLTLGFMWISLVWLYFLSPIIVNIKTEALSPWIYIAGSKINKGSALVTFLEFFSSYIVALDWHLHVFRYLIQQFLVLVL